MSSQQNPNSSPVPTQSLSFNDISNYFSLPLQDAANNLGVCSSVLKKICRENGLDRWPYRKFLSGKSVEEIKKCAARERTKALTTGRQSGSPQQNNEMSKLLIGKRPNLQQPGSKNIQIGQPHNLLPSSLTKGITAMDEFKYGFPSDGLSTVSNKWWGGSNRDGYRGVFEDGAETDEEDENHSEETPDVANFGIGEKEKPENGKEASKTDSQGPVLLTAIRKRAAEESREALRLGICRDYGVKKLGKKERMLLVQIFRSSLPKQWINGSS